MKARRPPNLNRNSVAVELVVVSTRLPFCSGCFLRSAEFRLADLLTSCCLSVASKHARSHFNNIGAAGVGHFWKKRNDPVENRSVQKPNKPLISFKISGPAWGTISKTALIFFVLFRSFRKTGRLLRGHQDTHETLLIRPSNITGLSFARCKGLD